MHDYLFSTDVVRLAFLAGVVASIVLYERTHLTTGSIVVPGYIAVFLIQPLVLLATFANALASWWIVNRLLPRWFLLYGRTKFTVLALISIAIQAGLLKLSPSTGYLWESDIPLLVGAGYVVPALVAHDMARQGVKKTLRAVTLAGAVVAVPVGLLLLTAGNPGLQLADFGLMAIDPSWVAFAVFLSAAAAWALLKNHDLRSGGFIGAAYTAMLAANPVHIVFIVGVGVASYLVVTKVLMRHMILFGRRKFAAMLLVSGVIAWTLIAIGESSLGVEISAYTTLASIALTPLFVPGLVANDMHRAGPARVLVGLALGGVWVLSTTLVVQAALERGVIETLPLVVAFVTGVYIFSAEVAKGTRLTLHGLDRSLRVPDFVVRPARALVVSHGRAARVAIRNTAFALGFVIAVGTLALAPVDADQGTAYQLGQALGRVALIVAIPVAARYFWARVLQRDPAVRVASGWLFVHAAVVALALV
ncbi:MAG: poly-gamma-glutamate biosynthesis protein PgsC/CapC [Gaiella sp.]